jgi:hypothetical protein
MSGLEVAAAIFGIISGLASAYRLAVELRKRHQRRKQDKGTANPSHLNLTVQRLQRVEKQLEASKARLARLNPARGVQLPANPAVNNDLAIQNVLAILQQLSTEDLAPSAEAPDLGPLERYTARWNREAELIAQSICPNAIRYRRNDCRFVDVAAPRAGSTLENEWACKLCGRCVSPVSLPLSRAFAAQGKVYVTPNGCFKAHTTEGLGWACIWEGRGDGCAALFARRRELLRHMQSVHVRDDVVGRRLGVDGPADVRERSVEWCGYGVELLGRRMEVEGDGFVIRYGDL